MFKKIYTTIFTVLFLSFASISTPVNAAPFENKTCADLLTHSTLSETIRAQQLLQRQDALFCNLFDDQYGFEKFKQNLAESAKTNPSLDRAKGILEKNQFEIVIYTSTLSTSDLLSRGLINFHQRMLLHKPDQKELERALSNRNHAEAAMLGIPKEEYKVASVELKPKYGMLKPIQTENSPRLFFKNPGYGGSGWVLKLPNIQNRLTFSYGGDSLNRFLQNYGAPLLPRSKGATIKHWSDLFIPWQYRALLAGVLSEAIQTGYFGNLEHGKVDPLFPNQNTNWSREYLEVQIFGPITADDIKAYEFVTPPTGDLLEMLNKHGIEIRPASFEK